MGVRIVCDVCDQPVHDHPVYYHTTIREHGSAGHADGDTEPVLELDLCAPCRRALKRALLETREPLAVAS